jgi:ATP-dependent DNA helicase PIF1
MNDITTATYKSDIPEGNTSTNIKKIKIRMNSSQKNIFDKFSYNTTPKSIDSIASSNSPDETNIKTITTVSTANPSPEKSEIKREKLVPVVLSDEQKSAIELFKQGKNIFLTGPGGTGKTLLIKEFIKESYLLDKKIQVCALTGCASLLLGQGARTIHSWSGIKLAKGPPEKIIENVLRNRQARKSWLTTDILVIDEVSMMSHKILNILEEVARHIRKTSKVFGGIQVIFCGDFYQLGPIGDQYELETKEYCFQSKKWFDIFPKENHIQLHTIFRQNDKDYIEILNEIREGSLSQKNIEILKKYVKRPYDETQHNNCHLTKLFPIRSRVDHINNLMFEKIEEPIQNYNMITQTNLTTFIETGKPFDEFTTSKCENLTFDEIRKEVEQLIANSNLQKELQLKKGAAVMCLTNLDLERGICNGSQGIIIDFINGKPKVKFSNGIIEIISIHSIQSEEYPSIAIGQYPLCLAWAMTIHKMQGATLDMAQIDIGNTIFDYGQTYVGLSRIRSLDGLYLSDFNPHRIKTNPTVQAFYKSL